MGSELLILVAFFLDLILGDPRDCPHPVRIIGYATVKLEKGLRRQFSNLLYIAGVVLWTTVVGGSFIVTWMLVKFGSILHPLLGMGVSCLFIYTAIATRDLDREAKDVYEALARDDIPGARRLLSRIVGRNTEDLPPSEIVRAAVESVAENTVDGIISPLFYAFLGGAPLAMAFKAVSTLDSMVGHNNERYKEFGWFSAKMDDLMNFIPARIAGAIIPLAALLLRMRARDSLKIMWRDRGKTLSPNSGIPEAAFSGALGVTLGGTNFYQGQRVDMPVIGKGLKDKDPTDILRAIRLMYGTSLIFLGIIPFAPLLLGRF